MQRRGAGCTEDRDDRVDLSVVERGVGAVCALGAPLGNGLLLGCGFGDVHLGFAAFDVGQREAEGVGGADVGERAEHAGQVWEVLVFAEPRDDAQLASGVVFDCFDGCEEVGGHRVEVFEPSFLEGVRGDESRRDPHLGWGVGNRRRRGHHDRSVAVAGSDEVGAGQDRFGSL